MNNSGLQCLRFKNSDTFLRNVADTKLALNTDASTPGNDFVGGGTVVTPILHLRKPKLREGS